jgi:lauroyl/myristoyl acyltransferase
MSVGSHLLNPPNLDLVKRLSWKFGRPKILAQGLRYYEEHPTEVDRIVANLDHMGLPSSGPALDEVLEQIVAHYYEKLFILVKGFEAVWIARNRVEIAPGALEPLEEAKAAGRGVFLAGCHFGATYLQALVLAARGWDLHAVGKFPGRVGQALRDNDARFAERYGTGRTRFLDVSDPDEDVPGAMLQALLTGGIVSNVFDENNAFSKPRRLLGRRLHGGSGMDLILRRFTDDRVTVLCPFLIRTGEDSFRFEIDRHSLGSADIVQDFYGSLERRVQAHPAQWYFIHELHEALEAVGP